MIFSFSDPDRQVQSRYLPKQDKVLFWDSENIGLRGDYNGVLLLDTILQTPVERTDDYVKLELLLSEAALFLQSMERLEEHGLESTTVINEFTAKIDEANASDKKGIKALKVSPLFLVSENEKKCHLLQFSSLQWNTVCLKLPYLNIKIVATNLLFLLKRCERHIPALAIASAINERLTDLLVGRRHLDLVNSGNNHRLLMYSEAIRRQTFARWPHINYRWALPNQLAQAGFYYQPRNKGDDRAMCFTCSVCLVCWEETDEPWSEHERNSPNCPFVKGEYTQNVPLAVTYATSPARKTDGFSIMSSGTQTDVICTGTQEGLVNLWKIKRQVKKLGCIDVRQDEQLIFKNDTTDDGTPLNLNSICTFNSSDHTAKTKDIFKGLRIVCGVSRGDKLRLVVYTVSRLPRKKSECSETIENEIVQAIDMNMNDDMKKIKLKNVLEDQLEDELVLMGSIPPNTPPPIPIIPTIITDDMELHLMNGSILDFPQSNNDKSETKDNAVASTSSLSDLFTDETEPIQCKPIEILRILSIFSGSWSISDIIPSYEPGYLLIVIKRSNVEGDAKDTEEITKMEIDEDDDDNADADTIPIKCVQLHVCRVEDSGSIAMDTVCVKALFDDHMPKQICMLPPLNDTNIESINDDTKNGIFAMVCNDGSLQLSTLTNLRTLSKIEIDDDFFVSVTYCKNLERLCACTSKGRLNFYSLYDVDIDSSDEHEDEKMNFGISDASGGDHEICEPDGSVFSMGISMPSSISIASTSNSPLQGNGISETFAYKNELNLNDLKILYQLTLFDEILTPFSAEVPACWNEFIEAQKQKRHSHHLRPGDDTHLIKTYRLHNDA